MFIYVCLYQDGCETISQGICQDIATVYYSLSDLEEDVEGIVILSPSSLISHTSFLALRLTTCMRRLTPTREQTFGFVGQAAFMGEIMIR